MSRIKLAKKKIDITDFFDPENIEDGETVFIYIKKLPYSIKKHIDTLSINTYSSKIGKEMLIKIDEQGLDIEDVRKDKVLLGKLAAKMELKDKELQLMEKNSLELAQIIINNGIDPLNHNIFDEKGEKIALDFDFFNEQLAENCIEYVINEIKILSKGFSLGK